MFHKQKKKRGVLKLGYLSMLRDYRSQKTYFKGIVLGSEKPLGKGKVLGKIPFTGKRLIVMLCAPQRRGKSVLGFRIPEELLLKFGVPSLIIDPKKEHWMHKFPLKDKYARPLLLHPEEVSGRPQGLGDNLVVVTPSVLQDAVNYTDFLVSPHLSDFLALKDLNLMENLFLEFFEIKGQGLMATRRQLHFTLEEVKKLPKKEQTFSEWVRIIVNYVEASQNPRTKSGVLLEKIVSLIKAKKVDVPGTQPLRMVSDLLMENKMVIMQTNLNSSPIAEYDVLMALSIHLCIEQRDFFPRGFNVFVDEIDKPCSSKREGSLLKQIIVDIPLKYGAYNIGLTGMTQKPNLVQPDLFEQADAIIVTSITRSYIKWLIENTNISPLLSDYLRALPAAKPPKAKWIILLTSEETILEGGMSVTYSEAFYPFATRSQFQVVGEGHK